MVDLYVNQPLRSCTPIDHCSCLLYCLAVSPIKLEIFMERGTSIKPKWEGIISQLKKSFTIQT